MSTYVISDLHGCKKEFDAMLELIRFNDEYDEMYIAGDVCDRGKEPIALLQEIMQHPNMHLIFGNHDVWLERYMDTLIAAKKDETVLYYHTLSSDLSTWLYYNGGLVTADQFMDLSFPECYDIQTYLQNPVFYKKLTVKGDKYLIVHAGLGSYAHAGVNIDEIPDYEFIWPHIDIDANPLYDTTMIVGHMPTFLYGDAYSGTIIHGKKTIHIDCGCVFGKTLGCLRLDDMKEFYIPSSYPSIN